MTLVADAFSYFMYVSRLGIGQCSWAYHKTLVDVGLAFGVVGF